MPSRRTFLKTTTAALASAAIVNRVHAGGGDTLRIGLVGCGGRGSGAAGNALNADPNVKLVAMADAFKDKLDSSLTTLKRDFPNKVDVPTDRQFVGFDAYKHLLGSGVDVVLLTTPPHFRPAHLKSALEAGKHVFCEKPMAVDGPGVRSVLASAALAKEKNLSLVSGFCFRYEPAKRETVKRIHDGAIGDVRVIEACYNTGKLWHVERKSGWSDMEWQMRNWPYFTWLSGDHYVEQHIHNLDKAAWVLNQYPVSAIGLGGRQVRTDPKFGHIFDHHAVIFEYANGTKVFSFCRQQVGCYNEVSDHIIGTKGSCHLMKHAIDGPNEWKFKGKSEDMYQVEHNELFASIRAGKPMNDGVWMAHSTLMGILGRMATYTGKKVTWEQALNSKENLSPEKYEWGSLEVAKVAMPGVTPVI